MGFLGPGTMPTFHLTSFGSVFTQRVAETYSAVKSLVKPLVPKLTRQITIICVLVLRDLIPSSDQHRHQTMHVLHLHM